MLRSVKICANMQRELTANCAKLLSLCSYVYSKPRIPREAFCPYVLLSFLAANTANVADIRDKKSVPAVARRGQLAGHRPSPLCPHDAGRCRRVLSGLQIKRRCKVTAFGATICGLFWFICQQNKNFYFLGHGHKY